MLIQIYIFFSIIILLNLLAIYMLVRYYHSKSKEECSKMAFQLTVLYKTLDNISTRENIDIHKYVEMSLNQLKETMEDK